MTGPAGAAPLAAERISSRRLRLDPGLNRIVRLADGDESRAIGTVQATVDTDRDQAEVAWVVGTSWQAAATSVRRPWR